jgi:hypothetical protein
MAAPTYTVPTNNSDTATEEPKVTTALSDLKSLLTANLDAANVSPTAALTDGMLASANNSVYKTINTVVGSFDDTITAGTYIQRGGGGSWAASPSTAASAAQFIYLDDADYTVAAKTAKLRVRLAILSNATTAAITFTAGLYPITVAGIADTMTITAGSVVGSSTAAIASPTLSAVSHQESSDFNIPTDGAYMLGIVLSGTVTANSFVSCTLSLQTRNT